MTKEAIVKGLKKVAGADKDKARLFADVIRDIIVDGLVADGVVKIKGLGTFKVVEVKARKSVDVNTGAEIEISAHKKVTFTAESQLANEVNEPLAHLEVVNIGGDVENNETDQLQEMTVEEKQEEMTATGVVDESKDEAIRKLSEDAEDLKGLLAMINGPLKPAEPEQPVAIEEPELPIEPELPAVTIEPEQPAITEQPEIPIEPEQPTVEPEKFVEPERRYEPTPIDLGPTPGKNKNVALRVAVIVVVAVLVGCGCFWGIKELGRRKTTDTSSSGQKKIVKVVKKSEDERVAEIERIKAEAQKNEQEQDTGYVYTGVKQPQKEEPIPVDNALAVIKVKEGDRLMTLSKQYYGHRMFWVYIYDANKSQLRNPDELRVGMTLVIPRMDKKLIDVENEESVQAAMELEAKFMSR